MELSMALTSRHEEGCISLMEEGCTALMEEGCTAMGDESWPSEDDDDEDDDDACTCDAQYDSSGEGSRLAAMPVHDDALDSTPTRRVCEPLDAV
jgi:hypothetical protein